jgi:aspartyl-tRNA(Asn)/glutamyl-tRNA(Gln) amidotransferase subunit A
VSRALGELESLGAELVGIRVPDIAEMNEIGRLILLAEATSVHIRNLELHYEDYGEDQRSILDQGRFISAVDYLNAQRRRRQMCEEFRRAAAGVDLIAAPTIPVLPAKIGEDMIECGGALQDVRLATTRNVRALNLTGWPLLSAPCGFSAGGLPIGLQLIGRAFDERTLLEVGHAYQQATDWHRRRPRIAEAEARG